MLFRGSDNERRSGVYDALLRAYNVVCFAITEMYISSASAASA